MGEAGPELGGKPGGPASSAGALRGCSEAPSSGARVWAVSWQGHGSATPRGASSYSGQVGPTQWARGWEVLSVACDWKQEKLGRERVQWTDLDSSAALPCRSRDLGTVLRHPVCSTV